MQTAAARAAAQAAAREHAQTREWLEKCGIPKATRVAQKEAFDVLRRHGMIEKDGAWVRSRPGRGAAGDHDTSRVVTASVARPLTPEEVADLAATCVALYEAQGRAVEDTLQGVGAEAGGWVPADDVTKVRQVAQRLLGARDALVECAGGEPPQVSPSITGGAFRLGS